MKQVRIKNKKYLHALDEDIKSVPPENLVVVFSTQMNGQDVSFLIENRPEEEFFKATNTRKTGIWQKTPLWNVEYRALNNE